MAKRRKMSDAELGALIGRALTQSDNTGTESGEAQSRALAYYYGQARPEDAELEPGQSLIQSTDLQEMVEAGVAMMAPGMGQETVCVFRPRGADDDDAAQIESDVCNAMLTAGAEQSGYIVMQNAVKDALLMRNCILKVYHEREEKSAEQRIAADALDPATLAAALQPRAPGEQVEAEREGDEVVITRTWTEQEIEVCAVAPENFRVTPGWPSLCLEGVPFCADRSYRLRGELLEEGLPRERVEAMPAAQPPDWRSQQRTGTVSPSMAGDKSADTVVLWDCYILADANGDGIPELIRAQCDDNGAVLKREPCEWRPYACGAAFIEPHRFEGLSLFDKLREVQDGKTQLLRGLMDNAAAINAAGVAMVEGQVNPLDAVSRRPGRSIRTMAQGAVTPLPVNDIGPSLLGGIQYLDKVRAERGGASLDMLQAGFQVAGDTAHGTEREYSAKEVLTALMMRNLGESVLRTAFLLVHRILREQWTGPVETKVRGEWQSVIPALWLERKAVEVRTGLTPGARQQRISALGQVIAFQKMALEAGKEGELTGLEQMHAAIMDWCRAAMLDAPGQYWIDPASPAAQQVGQGKAQAAQQQASREADILRELATLKAQGEAYKTQTEYAFKYFEQAMKAVIEEAKLVGAPTPSMAVTTGAAIGRSNETGGAGPAGGGNGAVGGMAGGNGTGAGAGVGAGLAS